MVKTISRPGPGTPRETWTVATVLPPNAAPSAVRTAKEQALVDPRFFAVCKKCGELQPTGYMCGDEFCQSCAVQNHGVVF